MQKHGKGGEVPIDVRAGAVDGPAKHKCRILIIGAGFAGLSAAKSLVTQTECEVIILEASGAVGGRARGGQLPSGANVELGATWFHGVRDNPVYDMAVWSGVVRDIRLDPEATKHDVDWQLHFARPNEKQLLSGEANKVAMEAVGSYSEAAEECTQLARSGDCSVGDVLRRTYDEIVTTDGLQGSTLQTFADAWHFREKLQRTFDGFFSTDDVSLAFAREYETLEGPNMPVPGGYQALAEILGQGVDIRYNHTVTAINYGPHGVSVHCSNGSVFDANCVIVTTSLGVLQSQHEQLFNPPLPEWKAEALSAVRIGVADKVFVEFEIEPSRAREAAAWLSSHANLGAGSPSASGHTTSVNPSPSPEHPSSRTAPPPGTNIATPGHNHQHHHQQPAALPPEVASLLPPPAPAGLPEPFNLGKRPTAQIWPPQTSRSAAQIHEPLHGPPSHQDSGGPSASEDSCTTTIAPAQDKSHHGRSRRRKQKRTIHSYAFLWPVQSPLLLGGRGHPTLHRAGFDARESAVCYDPLAAAQGYSSLDIPAWVQGLHSIRYCPGPEWIEPSLLQDGGSEGSKGKRNSIDLLRRSPTVSPISGGVTHVSGVLWITGNSALGMEAASDEEVATALTTLFKVFPQVPVPPGAVFPPKILRTKWGTDPLFMGSYSYVNVTEATGEVVDALAEPLCNDDGIPIVLFAGEATYRPCIGTVHGAFLSGCREADRLLEVQRLMQLGVPTGVSGELAKLHTEIDPPGTCAATGLGMASTGVAESEAIMHSA